ncbi:hypothetical protein C3486_11900 [Streptomyces sp. Ru73]|uniref:hypothetical protein n=1 Tax=Streptomyces sp. Ru73 TaxID=2080748 RepID=UPI000CDE4EFF|nr:hypothetical protein [Streptomyces sp. Ru73]POX40887.1 hypothetical protein C3486_11900 [Streptomyces sp. Ru73]
MNHASFPHFTGVVDWRHRRAGAAHSLVRAVHDPAARQTVVVVSELASNPADRGITDDFGSVADAVVPVLRGELAQDLGTVVWIAHFGEFSYDDPTGPETFHRIEVTGDAGSGHQDDLRGDRALSAQEVEALLKGRRLDPVPQVLTALGRQG